MAASAVSPASSPKKMRFASLNDENINKLMTEKDSINTRRATDSAVKMFKEYLKEKNVAEDVETLDSTELDKLLGKFYLEARNKNGELYKKASLTAFRHGLNRHFKDHDIVNGQDFKSSREAFIAMSSELKRQGLGGVDHHPPIEKADLQKLYASFDITDAASLQQKVFVDILLYFGRRGRENARQLKVSDFSCSTDSEGHVYIYHEKDEQTKNHRHDTNTADGRMYVVPDADERCPVKTFVRYKRMLPVGYDCLFPKVRKTPNKDGCYFDLVPMGHNKLGGMMAYLSEKADFYNFLHLNQPTPNPAYTSTSPHLNQHTPQPAHTSTSPHLNQPTPKPTHT
ncbi:uncharacterized protein LOC117338997 [Pecten maximus]|uniref:uncharacterized protein LOC117338997 n=1 Tax=Pecten maximus TaxID=6579 RepID=UPI0014581221|nr:uncharacterized protein LOC117338997 [Pecten maximus]